MQNYQGSPYPWKRGMWGSIKDANGDEIGMTYNGGHAFGRANENLVLQAPNLLEQLIKSTVALEEYLKEAGIGMSPLWTIVNYNHDYIRRALSTERE